MPTQPRRPATDVWCTFESIAQARRWTGARGLPAAGSQGAPWAPVAGVSIPVSSVVLCHWVTPWVASSFTTDWLKYENSSVRRLIPGFHTTMLLDSTWTLRHDVAKPHEAD